MDIKSTKILQGLNSSPKFLPSWYKYNEEGSMLYDERIENCQWYYYPREEVKLLKDVIQSNQLMQKITSCTVVADLGCGNAHKSKIFLDKLVTTRKRITYIPVDISEEHLHKTSDAIAKEYGDAIIIDRKPGDYSVALNYISREYQNDKKLILWFNGPICLEYGEQIRHLKNISNSITDEDLLLITVDVTSTDEREVIELAYNDPEGWNPVLPGNPLHRYIFGSDNSICCSMSRIRYCSRFHFNSIRRLNKEYNGNMDVSKFQMKNELISDTSIGGFSFVNLWIEPIEDCCFTIEKLDKTLDFKKGERLYFHGNGGITSKYTMDQIRHIINQSSLKVVNYWTSRHAAVILLNKQ